MRACLGHDWSYASKRLRSVERVRVNEAELRVLGKQQHGWRLRD